MTSIWDSYCFSSFVTSANARIVMEWWGNGNAPRRAIIDSEFIVIGLFAVESSIFSSASNWTWPLSWASECDASLFTFQWQCRVKLVCGILQKLCGGLHVIDGGEKYMLSTEIFSSRNLCGANNVKCITTT